MHLLKPERQLNSAGNGFGCPLLLSSNSRNGSEADVRKTRLKIVAPDAAQILASGGIRQSVDYRVSPARTLKLVVHWLPDWAQTWDLRINWLPESYG